MRRNVGTCVLVGFLVAGVIAGACSPSSGVDASGSGSNGTDDAGALTEGDGASTGSTGSTGSGGGSGLDLGNTQPLAISPDTASITVDPGAGSPDTVEFTLEGADGKDVTWDYSNEAVGTVDQNGVFTPTGRAGGVVEVSAQVGDDTVTAEVTVTIEYRQNGSTESNPGSTGPGAGGLEGVGGEGFGPGVSDDLVTTLEGSTTADPSLDWVYPYDETVFPLGILPPLLQWSSGENGPFDAVYVHVSAPPYYDYKGFFGRPSLLASGDDFLRHPIPEDVWEAATQTAAGSDLTVELVLAAGDKAYGPIRQTYKIALAPITGKIYYQAYNTDLAQNYDGSPAITGERMGGATLSIDVGAKAPVLVAGKNSTDSTGCRVCHSVSAYGDRMTVQHGDDYSVTSSYDLKNGNAETAPYQPGTFSWAGLYPDGSIALGNSVSVANTDEANGTTGLYDAETGALLPSSGLLDFATSIALPAFSPDGRTVAFTLFGGPSTPAVGAPDGRQLVAMDFDLATSTFSNPRKLWEGASAEERPAWPTFFPQSNALVFQRRWNGSTDELFASRYGARGELWWVDLESGTATPLDRTNGIGPDGQSYLPAGPNNHDADERLNFEPSISPVASGGYAWMVFMSRRMYGSVATMDPWFSDPREHNLRDDVTTKKIWMAAIDLDPEPGEDPSHPAFYIPGQELHGVNSRPFFALEPCISDAGRCSSGVDCCSGFCRDGYCVPPPEQQCSKIDERCDSADDCCDGSARCIGGFCAILIK